MSEGDTETPASHLEELFNKAKPKSRYISESHVEEETSSIAKEIINGDIEVRRTRGNVPYLPCSSTYPPKKTAMKKCLDADLSNK